ncbi:MAG: hypothetical protein ACT4OS_03050 [Acidimicrobiales bacterium]
MLLGDDILVYLVLALGAALVVGNVLALLRPPAPTAEEAVQPSDPTASDPTASDLNNQGDDGPARLGRPPLARTLVMIGIGLVATVWSLATFVTT